MEKFDTIHEKINRTMTVLFLINQTEKYKMDMNWGWFYQHFFMEIFLIWGNKLGHLKTNKNMVLFSVFIFVII